MTIATNFKFGVHIAYKEYYEPVQNEVTGWNLGHMATF